jgi:fumarate reductase flavoprotein subunit
MRDFEFRVPVIVAGGGASGCVAALAAADAGASVLVLEQDASPSGSTGMSQGLICAAGTRAQASAGVSDSADRYFDDIMTKTRGQTDPALARAVADAAGPCIDWLMDAHQLPFELDVRFRAAYGHSVARVHGWLGHGGSDLIQFLHRRLAETGVDVMLRARLVDVVAGDNGEVLGVAVARPDGGIEHIGCDALILATSGFAGDAAMVASHIPDLAGVDRHCHEGNDGLGITLAERIGGALADMGSYQGYAMLADPHRISLPPGQIVEGGVLINSLGRRFVDESEDISSMVHHVVGQPDGMAWAIYDQDIEAKCAYIPETQQLMALNAARHADSIEDLARAIEAPVDAVRLSLEDAAQAKAQGRPDSVGRSWAGATPPSAPYRALKVRGALYHTQGGLKIDANGQVIRRDGSLAPNLFASGGAAQGLSGPGGWGYLPAMGLCHAVTVGRLAGAAAARLVLGAASSPG